MPAFYEWTVRVQIPNTLVARGGVFDREDVRDHIMKELGAYEDENVKVMVTKEPDDNAIRREQE